MLISYNLWGFNYFSLLLVILENFQFQSIPLTLISMYFFILQSRNDKTKEWYHFKWDRYLSLDGLICQVDSMKTEYLK